MPAKPQAWSTRRLAMMSGTRKPKLALLIVNELSLMIAPWLKKFGAVASSVPALRVAGSSSDSVPEKPLPNWAV